MIVFFEYMAHAAELYRYAALLFRSLCPNLDVRIEDWTLCTSSVRQSFGRFWRFFCIKVNNVTSIRFIAFITWFVICDLLFFVIQKLSGCLYLPVESWRTDGRTTQSFVLPVMHHWRTPRRKGFRRRTIFAVGSSFKITNASNPTNILTIRESSPQTIISSWS